MLYGSVKGGLAVTQRFGTTADVLQNGWTTVQLGKVATEGGYCDSVSARLAIDMRSDELTQTFQHSSDHDLRC